MPNIYMKPVLSFVMFSVSELLILQTATMWSWKSKPGIIDCIWIVMISVNFIQN